MMPGWVQRMNRRERILATIVAGIVFLLINLYVWGKLFSTLNQAAPTWWTARTAHGPEIYIKERGLWEKRAHG